MTVFIFPQVCLVCTLVMNVGHDECCPYWYVKLGGQFHVAWFGTIEIQTWISSLCNTRRSMPCSYYNFFDLFRVLRNNDITSEEECPLSSDVHNVYRLSMMGKSSMHVLHESKKPCTQKPRPQNIT